MFIQTETTPNPDTLKFLPGRIVLADETAEFLSKEDAERSPLAKALFKFKNVKSIFLGGDFISISKTSEGSWDLLKPQLLAEIMDFFVSSRPVLETQVGPATVKEEDPLVVQIRELLDTRIRPAVAMDGGDIIFDRFEDGIVYVRMQGACSGCPSSSATLKAGIENMLRYYVPEVLEVQPVEL